MLIEIEVVVKSDAQKLDMVCKRNRCTGNFSMEVRLISDPSRF